MSEQQVVYLDVTITYHSGESETYGMLHDEVMALVADVTSELRRLTDYPVVEYEGERLPYWLYLVPASIKRILVGYEG